MRHPVMVYQDKLNRPTVSRLSLLHGRFTEFGREWIHEQPWITTPAGIGIPRAAGGSGLSQYAEAKIVDHSNGKTSWTMPANSYMALCTNTVTSASTGSTITEANYTGYARYSQAGNWTAATTGVTPSVGVNTAQINFAACTGGSSTVTFFALCDASTTGNMIWWGTLASVLINTSQTPATVAAGVLQTSLT